jgi:hypothetical protein
MNEDTVRGLSALLDESELSREITRDIEAGRTASTPTGLSRRGGVVSSVRGDTTPSFQEQLARIDSAATTLREAIHRKVHEVKAAHDLRIVEIGIAYERAMTTAGEQRERDVAAAERQTRETLAEIDRIVARL